MDNIFWKSLAIASLIIAGVLLAINLMQQSDIDKYEECKQEATAWYNATVTQADEFYYWMSRGQQPGELDFGVSHIFIAKGHELNCIATKLPTG